MAAAAFAFGAPDQRDSSSHQREIKPKALFSPDALYSEQ
jgi:hypothetical protein